MDRPNPYNRREPYVTVIADQIRSSLRDRLPPLERSAPVGRRGAHESRVWISPSREARPSVRTNAFHILPHANVGPDTASSCNLVSRILDPTPAASLPRGIRVILGSSGPDCGWPSGPVDTSASTWYALCLRRGGPAPVGSARWRCSSTTGPLHEIDSARHDWGYGFRHCVWLPATLAGSGAGLGSGFHSVVR